MKRTPVFSAEDFEVGPITYAFRLLCAEAAEAKLDALIESWPVVYGMVVSGEHIFNSVRKDSIDTHSARLAFIEELPKRECEHDGAPQFISKSSTQLDGYTYPVFAESYKCRKCGAHLKAKWETE